MISEVRVCSFKRFSDTRFDFSPLTVLAGLNGSGKTSLIQALLLAYDASIGNASTLALNGPFGMGLGVGEDVLNWDCSSPISISVVDQAEVSAEWRFEVLTEESLYLDVVSKPSEPPLAFSGVPRSFTYLSAERLGPKNIAAISSLPDDELEVGSQGEFSAHVLSLLGDRLMNHPERQHPLHHAEASRLLKYEVEQWLSEIARPIEITGERATGSMVAELRFRTPGSSWVRATNMGFGLTYALPIILAGLIAHPGGMMIVENPEAHLHPAGQSRMGVFLAWLAGRGVQVVIETHSDHVLNGIRRGVAEYSYLSASSAAIHWFGDVGGGIAEEFVQKIFINESGGLSDWPAGFFDQYQMDVASLGRLRRNRT